MNLKEKIIRSKIARLRARGEAATAEIACGLASKGPDTPENFRIVRRA